MLYLPYGEEMARQKVAGWATPYTFTGKEKDDLTGLQYFGARYYDSRISIWYGVDPMAEEMPEYNSYCYTFNNPIRFIDPDGKAPGDPPIGAMIAGQLKAGIANLIGLAIKYSPTSRGLAMRTAGVSYDFNVYEDPDSETGLSVGGGLVLDQSPVKDVFRGVTATLDLAPLSPSKGGVSALSKIPTGAGSALKGWIGKDLYSGMVNSKQLKEALESFEPLLDKGVVRGVGEAGIKKLSGSGKNVGGKVYEYELKSAPKSKFGNWRLYGNKEAWTNPKTKEKMEIIIFKAIDDSAH